MNNKKDSLFIKYMKNWYGIQGTLDEYKQSKIEHIGNNAFFIFWIGMTITCLAAIAAQSLFGFEPAYFIMITGWFLLLMGVSIYITQTVRKLKLDIEEVEEKDLPQAKKRAWKRGIRSGLLFGILFTIIESFGSYKLFSLFSLFTFIFTAFFFGLFTSFIYQSRIKVIKEN